MSPDTESLWGISVGKHKCKSHNVCPNVGALYEDLLNPVYQFVISLASK